ncbi:MAG: UbiX family flavin prenyltransferase [Bacillota bacterium]|nr:UbiX family flavin prenyltransferase [Bacillota bacterium]
MKKIIIGVTGASGSNLAENLIIKLLKLGHQVELVVTENGQNVLEYELEKKLQILLKEFRSISDKFKFYSNKDMFANIASGSYKIDAMIIIPCSMGSLAKIANGISDSLMLRSADVAVKEKTPLILVTRESPLSSIHLENMLKLSRLGVVIMPPVLSYYNKPKSLQESNDIFIGRILNFLKIENSCHKVWGSDDE